MRSRPGKPSTVWLVESFVSGILLSCLTATEDIKEHQNILCMIADVAIIDGSCVEKIATDLESKVKKTVASLGKFPDDIPFHGFSTAQPRKGDHT